MTGFLSSPGVFSESKQSAISWIEMRQSEIDTGFEGRRRRGK